MSFFGAVLALLAGHAVLAGALHDECSACRCIAVSMPTTIPEGDKTSLGVLEGPAEMSVLKAPPSRSILSGVSLQKVKSIKLEPFLNWSHVRGF